MGVRLDPFHQEHSVSGDGRLLLKLLPRQMCVGKEQGCEGQNLAAPSLQ